MTLPIAIIVVPHEYEKCYNLLFNIVAGGFSRESPTSPCLKPAALVRFSVRVRVVLRGDQFLTKLNNQQQKQNLRVVVTLSKTI